MNWVLLDQMIHAGTVFSVHLLNKNTSNWIRLAVMRHHQ